MAFFEVKNIHKKFSDVSVLKGIDFSMEKGEVVSIIGSSGSGKTTLLRCMNFLTTPDEGKMYLDNALLYDADQQRKLKEKEIREKRSNFGLVFQQFHLFPQYTVLENLCLAPRLAAKKREDYKKNKKEIFTEIEKRALDLLGQIGLSEKKDNHSFELSGGQQQRVAIARALMLSPKILCFDEPTSALDPELTGEVLRVLRALAQKKITMIIVTHEMEFARQISDKVVFMSEGVIAEEGAPEELFSNPKSPRLQAFLAQGKDA